MMAEFHNVFLMLSSYALINALLPVMCGSQTITRIQTTRTKCSGGDKPWTCPYTSSAFFQAIKIYV